MMVGMGYIGWWMMRMMICALEFVMTILIFIFIILIILHSTQQYVVSNHNSGGCHFQYFLQCMIMLHICTIQQQQHRIDIMNRDSKTMIRYLVVLEVVVQSSRRGGRYIHV